MKKEIICPKGTWDIWSQEQREALVVAKQITDVGDKIAYQNEKFRVWTIHLPAGQSLPFHKHAKPYFWTALASGESRSYYDSGEVVETHYDIGDTLNFPELSEENYFIHNLINVGNSTLIFSTIEFL